MTDDEKYAQERREREEKYAQETTERDVRQKYLDEIVKAAMERVMVAIAGRLPTVKVHFFYGASAIDPQHLVTWYVFSSDAEWKTAESTGLISDIDRLTRAELIAGSYPPDGAEMMAVVFTSDEDIQRKTGGDYWTYIH
jgi:hypothetical protein